MRHDDPRGAADSREQHHKPGITRLAMPSQQQNIPCGSRRVTSFVKLRDYSILLEKMQSANLLNATRGKSSKTPLATWNRHPRSILDFPSTYFFLYFAYSSTPE